MITRVGDIKTLRTFCQRLISRLDEVERDGNGGFGSQEWFTVKPTPYLSDAETATLDLLGKLLELQEKGGSK